MIATASILLKTLLSTVILTAFVPLLFTRYKKLLVPITLLCIFSYLLETISITYFYIYGGRASWTMTIINSIPIEFGIEPMGLVFLNLLSILWLISVLYSAYYMRAIRDFRYISFLMWLGLAIAAASIIALARNLFVMFIGYELLTLITIPLIAHNGMHHKQIMTYIRILIFSSLGLFLPFIFLVQLFAGTTQFTLGGILNNNTPFMIGHLLLLLSIFGIAKAGLYPLYKWLPAAMIAPYPVSALLHAVAVVKAGLFCIFKIIVYIFGFQYIQELTTEYNWPIIVAGLTMLYASYKAITHDSIKNILAYSTVSQLALTLLATFLFTEVSMIASISHMISHSFAKIALFFISGRFYAAVGISHIDELRGIGYKLPAPSIFFIIASLSLIGIPPFAGSYSKHLIFEAILEHKHAGFLIAVVVISTLLTAAYLIKIIYYIFAKREEELFIESLNTKSIFRTLHKTNSYAMDASIALCCVGLSTFPIIEKFLQNILWSIL